MEVIRISAKKEPLSILKLMFFNEKILYLFFPILGDDYEWKITLTTPFKAKKNIS